VSPLGGPGGKRTVLAEVLTFKTPHLEGQFRIGRGLVYGEPELQLGG
jgi:hypothetical protein